MHVTLGNRTFTLGRRRHEMPPALTSALAAVPPNRTFLAQYGKRLRTRNGTPMSCPQESGKADLRDLPAILRIASLLPDTAPEAEINGFLRARFGPRQYRRLIGDGCVRVARSQGEVVGFASIIPWRHPLIALERAAIQWGAGPCHLGFVHWTGADFSRLARTANLIYIAEVAIAPDQPHAASRMLRVLLKSYGEYPEAHFLSACSEIPQMNARAAVLFHRLGLQRVGCVRLPFRLVRSGPYPGRVSVVAPSQSGIWLRTPLRKATAPAAAPPPSPEAERSSPPVKAPASGYGFGGGAGRVLR